MESPTEMPVPTDVPSPTTPCEDEGGGGAERWKDGRMLRSGTQLCYSLYIYIYRHVYIIYSVCIYIYIVYVCIVIYI